VARSNAEAVVVNVLFPRGNNVLWYMYIVILNGSSSPNTFTYIHTLNLCIQYIVHNNTNKTVINKYIRNV